VGIDSQRLDALTVEAYASKETKFAFRRRTFSFALSHGLFSAAGIDTGSRLLLKILSKTIDEDREQGVPPPRNALDAGCGVGVLGICAAAVLDSCCVRCQDRDELARAFTLRNAHTNRVPPDRLSAHTEPLLACPPDARWDLILSNLPAKAGEPVLEDFARRSAALLSPGGRALVVIVHTLRERFRAWLSQAGAPVLREERGTEHTVFMYGPASDRIERLVPPDAAYHRLSGVYEIEGVSYRLDSIHGVRDFDTPHGTVRVAAKLIARGGNRFPGTWGSVLIHEPGQGHFPVWLVERLASRSETLPQRIVFSGRNILALEIARHNTERSSRSAVRVEIVPLADLVIGRDLVARPGGYDLIAAFPEPVPQVTRPLWEGIAPLASPGGIAILSLAAGDAARFDRTTCAPLVRLSDIKLKGFRAFARSSPPAAGGTARPPVAW
jgi:hypothetical protein